jgi:hypothetical protein
VMIVLKTWRSSDRLEGSLYGSDSDSDSDLDSTQLESSHSYFMDNLAGILMTLGILRYLTEEPG